MLAGTTDPTRSPMSDHDAPAPRDPEAASLAVALLARLRASGRGELAATLAVTFGAEGIIDPTPPDPHRPGTST